MGTKWRQFLFLNVVTERPVPTAALIVNARSRKGRRLFRDACQLLDDAGIRLSMTRAVRDPAIFADHVREAVESGVPMVIIGGGDGSISCAVDHFVGHDTTFGLLPLGTANSFARTLGVPLDLVGAIGVIKSGRTSRIDLGMINGDYFANCATIGIAPQIAETVPHGLKSWLGRPGYLLWAAHQLARFKPFRLTIGEGKRAESFYAVEVRIANGPYHGGIELIDGAEVDSGLIVVQAVTGETRRHLIWNWTLSLIRHGARERTVREFSGKAIAIATDPPLPISIDGEVLARTPILARIAPRAIRVAVP